MLYTQAPNAHRRILQNSPNHRTRYPSSKNIEYNAADWHQNQNRRLSQLQTTVRKELHTLYHQNFTGFIVLHCTCNCVESMVNTLVFNQSPLRIFEVPVRLTNYTYSNCFKHSDQIHVIQVIQQKRIPRLSASSVQSSWNLELFKIPARETTSSSPRPNILFHYSYNDHLPFIKRSEARLDSMNLLFDCLFLHVHKFIFFLLPQSFQFCP